MDNGKQINKTMRDISKQIQDMVLSCNNKDELLTMNDCFADLMKNYNDKFRWQLLQLDRQQEEELEKLRKIKALLTE